MGYTAPRTWVAGEVITNTLLNAGLRDNFAAIGGPWTYWPVAPTSTTGGFGLAVSSGRFLQRGKTVDLALSITITTVGTASGNVLLGLPVPAVGTQYMGSGRNVTTGAQLHVLVTSTTQAALIRFDNGATATAPAALLASLTYETV